jgi:methylmalonyl-CoA/ethylmalonyl-CoA epimerase
MKLKIDHIGYVVKNLNEAKKYFKECYNFKVITKTIYEKVHGVKLIFLDMGANTIPALEIIQPINKQSKVYNFLKVKGESLHHIAYEVNDVNKELKNFTKKGFLQISTIVPGAGHNMTKTIWLMGKKKELIELVEKQKNKKLKSRFTK